MANETLLEKMTGPLQSRASVKKVFGEPINAHGKTIVPVAQIAFGFGGGFGKGNQNSEAAHMPTGSGEGAGGGGGMYARPKGVYEITEQGTRFIPASRVRPLVFAAVAGFLLRGWLMRR